MPAADDRPLEELDEPGLVGACLAQRAGAFDLIVERHRRAVYQLCYRFVGNHEDASDLSQDVFLRAYRGCAAFVVSRRWRPGSIASASTFA
jgi:DNA-directed RNA polymerase specialized sigma24 family protein